MGLMIVERREEAERKIIETESEFERLFMLLKPKAYQDWKAFKARKRAEEGVDEVVYQGESEEAFREIARLGLDRPPPPNI